MATLDIIMFVFLMVVGFGGVYLFIKFNKEEEE